MAAFVVEEASSIGCRLGRILRLGSQNGLNIETPTCTIYTRHGHIPHLSHDVVESLNLLPAAAIYQLPLPTLLLDCKFIAEYGRGLKSFVGLPNSSLVYVSFHDPAQPMILDAHSHHGAYVKTKDGRILVDINRYRLAVEAFKDVNCLQPFCDSATPADCTGKRLKKSVEHTAKFTQQCMDVVEEEGCSAFILGSVEGGLDPLRREESVQLIADLPVEGFVLEGFNFSCAFGDNRFSVANIAEVLRKTLASLSLSKPRFFPGPLDPKQVFELVSMGIDVTDSSYAYLLTENSQMLELHTDYPCVAQFELHSITNPSYAASFTKPVPSCCCYTCATYSRAYLHHLSITDEMLRFTLLMIHNLANYYSMFDKIRRYIRNENA